VQALWALMLPLALPATSVVRSLSWKLATTVRRGRTELGASGGAGPLTVAHARCLRGRGEMRQGERSNRADKCWRRPRKEPPTGTHVRWQ
jgi:hypothetical protein